MENVPGAWLRTAVEGYLVETTSLARLRSYEHAVAFYHEYRIPSSEPFSFVSVVLCFRFLRITVPWKITS